LGSRYFLSTLWDKEGKQHKAFGQERRNDVMEETKKQVFEVKINQEEY
jgi:hypothetical protein